MPLSADEIAHIEQQAADELRLEEIEAYKEKHKARIRARRGLPWHVKLFPWRLKLVRIDDGR